MPEIATPVQTVRLTYQCDECSEDVRSTGVMLPSNPPQYPHACSNGHTVTLATLYPTIGYVDAR